LDYIDSKRQALAVTTVEAANLYQLICGPFMRIKVNVFNPKGNFNR